MTSSASGRSPPDKRYRQSEESGDHDYEGSDVRGSIFQDRGRDLPASVQNYATALQRLDDLVERLGIDSQELADAQVLPVIKEGKR